MTTAADVARAAGWAGPPPTVDDVVATFRRWLFLPDPGAVLVAVGGVAANYLDGDPVWPLLVGPPGSGKTEIVGALSGLENVYPAATLTEAALLSGSPQRERQAGAKGGLLREIGEFGIITMKDFGSVLSMNRDTRAQALAALREVYDGSWTRHVGVDGGRTLHWSGKVGLVAGCTPSIDTHYAVIGAMGERFVMFRLPDVDAAEQARRTLEHVGRESEMRAELADAVARLLGGRRTEHSVLSEAETVRLIALASLAVRARSAVERDGYSREIVLVPGAEAPTRLVKQLERLLAGLDTLGVERTLAWEVVTKVGLDCIPQPRRGLLEYAIRHGDDLSTKQAATELGLPTPTLRRAFEELTAYGLARRTAEAKGSQGDRYAITDWTRERYAAACVPEMSEGDGVVCVPEKSEPLLNTHTVERDNSGTQTVVDF